MKKITISTGGTGGHVIPAQILYDYLAYKNQVVIISDKRGINYLNKKKIALCITSTSNAASVAEHVLSMFIYLTKNLSLSDNLVKQGNFDKRSELPDIFELYKKKVLIIGFG